MGIYAQFAPFLIVCLVLGRRTGRVGPPTRFESERGLGQQAVRRKYLDLKTLEMQCHTH
jgi:hypothetical protein